MQAKDLTDQSFGKLTVLKRAENTKDGRAQFEFWRKSMLMAEKAYLFLVSNSKPEEARCVLPLSLKTELVMTANIREWKHFLYFRTPTNETNNNTSIK